MWSQSTNVTDGQTDGRHAIARSALRGKNYSRELVLMTTSKTWVFRTFIPMIIKLVKIRRFFPVVKFEWGLCAVLACGHERRSRNNILIVKPVQAEIYNNRLCRRTRHASGWVRCCPGICLRLPIFSNSNNCINSAQGKSYTRFRLVPKSTTSVDPEMTLDGNYALCCIHTCVSEPATKVCMKIDPYYSATKM